MASTVLAKMAVQISANTAELVRATQQGSMAVRGMTKTVETAGKLMATYFGTQAIFSGIRYGISVLAGFEQQMQEVRAVTGATDQQFRQLLKNATDLGAATEYTATQVAGLQAEYGRLGFTTKEIINSTKATLNLATATRSDLARSAEIAGSTLRAFQLDAKEMGRVTDVMSSSFNKSALQLDNFAESIKYVAPIAKAAGVSLEETTAYLSALADAGIKGSQAGTGMRRIFAELAKDGRPVAERMQELANKGLTLTDAFDEVGRYAQTALLVLASQNTKVKELTKTYQEAQGEAKKTADLMRDTLVGDFKLLTSAIDGVIQKGTLLSNMLRGLTQQTTRFISSVGGARDFQNAMEALAIDINSGGKSVEFYTKLLAAAASELQITEISVTDLSTAIEGMGNRAVVFEQLKNILRELNIEITDLSNKQLGPNQVSLFDPPPGFEEKQAEAARLAAALNAQYRERLELIRQIQGAVEIQSRFEAEIAKPVSSIVIPASQTPDLSGLSKPPMEKATKGIQDYVDQLRKAQAETDKLNQKTAEYEINVSGLVSGALTDFADALGRASVSSAGFGDNILKAVSGFMKSFGQQLIALGTAKLGLDKLFATGYGAAFAIAAGVALVAAAGAVSQNAAASVASISAGGTGNVGAPGTVRANDVGQNWNVEFKIRGQDLVGVLAKANESNKIRKG